MVEGLDGAVVAVAAAVEETVAPAAAVVAVVAPEVAVDAPGVDAPGVARVVVVSSEVICWAGAGRLCWRDNTITRCRHTRMAATAAGHSHRRRLGLAGPAARAARATFLD